MNPMDALLEILRDEGVDRIFGNPGTTELPFIDALADDAGPRVRARPCRRRSAVAMADGYARATGRTAFVNLHVAAGLANGLIGMLNAKRSRTPLVVTAGQQDRRHLLAGPDARRRPGRAGHGGEQAGGRGAARARPAGRRCAGRSRWPPRPRRARCSCRSRWTCWARRSTSRCRRRSAVAPLGAGARAGRGRAAPRRRHEPGGRGRRRRGPRRRGGRAGQRSPNARRDRVPPADARSA